FAASLPALPRQAAPARARAWWDRTLSRLVDVRPTASAVASDPADRAAGLAALQLEFGLARAAIERRDEDAYRAALARADGWVVRLWPGSAGRERQRAALQALQAQPLSLQLPTLGSTLEQLRRQRDGCACIQRVHATSNRGPRVWPLHGTTGSIRFITDTFTL